MAGIRVDEFYVRSSNIGLGNKREGGRREGERGGKRKERKKKGRKERTDLLNITVINVISI